MVIKSKLDNIFLRVATKKLIPGTSKYTKQNGKPGPRK